MINKKSSKINKYLILLLICPAQLLSDIEICNLALDRLSEISTKLSRMLIRKQEECIEKCHILQSAGSPLETVTPEILAEINTRCDMCEKLNENQIIPPITKATNVPAIARYSHILKWRQELGAPFFDWSQQFKNPSLPPEELQKKYTQTCGSLTPTDCCKLYGGNEIEEQDCKQDGNMRMCAIRRICQKLPQKTPCDKNLAPNDTWRSSINIPNDWKNARENIITFLTDHNPKTSDQAIVDLFEQYAYGLETIDNLYDTLNLLAKLENCKKLNEEVGQNEICCQGVPAQVQKTQKCVPLDKAPKDIISIQPEKFGLDKFGITKFIYDDHNATDYQRGTYRVGYWILKETLEKMHGKNTLYKIIPAALPAATNEMIPIPENTNFRLGDYQGGFVGIGKLFGTDKTAAENTNTKTIFTLFAYILEPGTKKIQKINMYTGAIQPGNWQAS